MNLTPHRSDDFNRDFDLQYRWYDPLTMPAPLLKAHQ